jgi:hypothetical protein
VRPASVKRSFIAAAPCLEWCRLSLDQRAANHLDDTLAATAPWC